MECPICHQKAEKKCAACKTVAYCCLEHQKADWKNHKKVCQPFSIEKIEGFGLGWVATRDLKAGFLLLEEVPVVQAPGWRLDSSDTGVQKFCYTCGNGMKNNKRTCSTCSWPVCSAECEKHPIHKENECKEFVSRKFKYPPPSSWSGGMLIMCLRANLLKSRDPEKFKQLMALQDFYTISSSNPFLRGVHQLPPGMWEMLVSNPNYLLDREELQKLLRISKVNGFENGDVLTYLGDGPQVRNVCVYLKTSRLNHSCSANCTMTVSSMPTSKMGVFTTVAVAKGEQLTLNYYEWTSFQSTADRQKVTTNPSVGFVCNCKRCTDPTELNTFLSGVKCFNCSGHLKADANENVGFFLPVNPLHDPYDSNPEYKCHSCLFKAPFLVILAQLPDDVVRAFTYIHEWTDEDTVDMESLEDLLEKYEKGRDFKDHLHRNHWIFLAIIKLVIQKQGFSDLGKMTLQDLKRHLGHLDHLLEVDAKLSPGLRKSRYDYCQMWEDAASRLLGSNFAAKMSKEEVLKLLRRRYKIQIEQLAYLCQEVPRGTEEEKRVKAQLAQKKAEYFQFEQSIQADSGVAES